MTFVSYAQNNEDVMLLRVFRGLDAGFYIDVGAQDPRIDSVTKAFYDRGWRGINLEPVAFWYQKLCRDRPRDINLCLAAGAEEAVVDFYEIADTGLSTSNAEFAHRHQAQGYELIARKVPVRTLDAICAEHGVKVVHFLKVDAEGAEADVLQGMDLVSLRPWLILVEATEPNSVVSTHTQWEPLLVDRGYRFVYDDGLNRFYVATEHSMLSDAFSTPPNVYDNFEQRILVDHRDHQAGLEKHIAAITELSDRRVAHIEQLDRIIVEKADALAGSIALQAQTQASFARSQEVLAEREARLSQLQNELAEREVRLSALQAQLVERDSILSVLRGVVAEHEIELQSRQAEIASLAARLQRSDRSVADLSLSLIDSRALRLESDARLAAVLAENARTLAALAQTKQDVQDILSSRSWRLTRPLRRIMTMAIAARRSCARVPRWLASLPWARRTAALVLKPFPSVATRVKRWIFGQHLPDLATIDPPTLSPRTLPISDDAEQILARCPVLNHARSNEGAD